MPRLHFSAEQDEKMIDFIQSNPCLYDRRHTRYKSKEAKHKLWEDFAVAINRSETDCRRRWKHLRDYANRPKHKDSIAYGGGSRDLLRRLKFLQEDYHDNPQRFAFSFDLPPPSPSLLDERSFDISNNPLLLAGDYDNNAQPSDGVEDSMSVSATSTGADNAFETESQDSKHDVFKLILNAPSESTRKEMVIDNKINVHDNDGLSSFFKAMEASTRILPVPLQIRIKREISKIVWDAEEVNEQNVHQNQESGSHK